MHCEWEGMFCYNLLWDLKHFSSTVPEHEQNTQVTIDALKFNILS